MNLLEYVKGKTVKLLKERDEELIKKIQELENFWNYTPKDDFFGRGWDHAKEEIIKIIKSK